MQQIVKQINCLLNHILPKIPEMLVTVEWGKSNALTNRQKKRKQQVKIVSKSQAAK
jgi:hypothetical protein